jgi:hypothetical protein
VGSIPIRSTKRNRKPSITEGFFVARVAMKNGRFRGRFQITVNLGELRLPRP